MVNCFTLTMACLFLLVFYSAGLAFCFAVRMEYFHINNGQTYLRLLFILIVKASWPRAIGRKSVAILLVDKFNMLTQWRETFFVSSAISAELHLMICMQSVWNGLSNRPGLPIIKYRDESYCSFTRNILIALEKCNPTWIGETVRSSYFTIEDKKNRKKERNRQVSYLSTEDPT